MAWGQIWQKFPKLLRFMALFPSLVGSITWPHFKACRVNNLATFVSLPFFWFMKDLFFLQGEWDKKQSIQKKNENCRVNNLATCPPKNMDKNVARLSTLRRPGYWPYFFLPQKAENLVFKILKKPYFSSVLGPKRENNLDSPPKQNHCTCKHNWPCSKCKEVLPLLGGCFFLGCFFCFS